MADEMIETLRNADIDVVARLHARCFYDSWDSKMIRQVLDMPGAFGFVARRAGYGSIIGFALARIAVDECELLSLGVAAEHRAQGIGARLLAKTIERAEEERARWFFLEVAEDNGPAIKLYRGRGLVEVGRRPDYYENADGSRTSAYTMRCALPVVADRMRGADYA